MKLSVASKIEENKGFFLIIEKVRFKLLKAFNEFEKIYEIRGFQVMLDYDLAEMYEVETKRLNEIVKRNLKRFPEDFMFKLDKQDVINLRSQIATSSSHGGTRYLPYAFTEQGVAMLNGLLNSDVAIQVNIMIMRIFVQIRKFALSNSELSEKLKEIESKYDKQFDDVFDAINYLLKKDKIDKQTKSRQEIGYKIND